MAGFVIDLPVSRINGVGKLTAEKLKHMGVVTCGDLSHIPIEDLAKHFGKYGLRLEPRKREDADQLALFDSE